MRVAIAGATGLVGALLTQKLINSQKIKAINLVGRRPSPFESDKMIFLKTDFENMQRLEKIDIAFCCLGTTINKAGSKENFEKVDKNFVINFASSLDPNTTLVIISAKGSDAYSRIFYNRVKGEMEQSIIDMKLKKLILIRPSLLIGERTESRPMESLGIKLLSPIKDFLAPVLKTYTPVDASDVANLMFDLAVNNESNVKNIEYQIFEND